METILNLFYLENYWDIILGRALILKMAPSGARIEGVVIVIVFVEFQVFSFGSEGGTTWFPNLYEILSGS